MRRSITAVLGALLLPAACSSGGSGSGGSVALTGAGATFPYPLYTRWIAEYARSAPGVAINYQSIGSGGGVRQIIERTVDFGASDAPMTDEQLERARGVLHIPTCAGAVVIAYHLDGVGPGMRLTPDTLAGIFLGHIRTWDDPRLRADNPGVTLPPAPIVPVHRTDGSGTTRIFTDYLTAVSPTWANGPGAGTSVAWPGGLGAKGNEGVSGQIKTQPGTIGYIELAYAMQSRMTMASLLNRAGRFIAPSIPGITAAAAGAASRMPEDLRLSIVNAEGEDAYPIAGFTYLLVHSKQQDPDKGRALKGFITWALGPGQTFTEALHYAPLPPLVIEKAQKRLSTMTGPIGQPL